MKKPKKILFSNVVRYWKKSINNANDAIFFSPYITSKTAEIVLKQAKPEDIVLYTLFDLELFVHGSSSIYTLKNLTNFGIKIYKLENLHAKILLTDQTMTIGSQNLTNRGARNLESTVIINDKVELAKTKTQLESWTKNRLLITIGMINDIISVLPELKKAHKDLSNEIEKAKETLIHKEELRKKEAQKILLEKINSNKVKYNRSKISNCMIRNMNYGSYITLHADAGEDLTSWIINDKEVNLDRLKRYLLIDCKSGRLCWARISKTRITFFQPKLIRNARSLGFNHWLLTLELTAKWDTTSGDNLTVELIEFDTKARALFDCRFDLDTVHDLKLIKEKSKDLDKSPNFINWIKSNKKNICQEITICLIEPFDYQYKLLGHTAKNFFDNYWGRIKIRTYEINEYPVLVADRF